LIIASSPPSIVRDNYKKTSFSDLPFPLSMKISAQTKWSLVLFFYGRKKKNTSPRVLRCHWLRPLRPPVFPPPSSPAFFCRSVCQHLFTDYGDYLLLDALAFPNQTRFFGFTALIRCPFYPEFGRDQPEPWSRMTALNTGL